jgi:hypothetical protein
VQAPAARVYDLDFSLRIFAPAPLWRSNENFTSAAVTGSPLWNVAFLRMTNSYVSRPSTA